MKFTKNTILIATAMLFVLTGCKKEQGCKDPLATNYNADAEEDDGSCTYPAPYSVPTTYVFTDDNNNSTVSYSGQTDRMNMLSEMVSYLKTANGPDESGTNATLDAQKLKDMYSNSGTPGFTGTGVGSSGKDLKSKTANSSTIQAQFETWMDSAAAGSGGTVTGYLQGADGREWTQLIEKGLMGACFAFQITENYLTDNKIGTNVNNTDAVCFEMDEFFSTMEHHWDEAYGYFTDAIDYPTSGTDRFWGKYANKSYMNGLGEEIVSAFIKGRAAISASRHQEGDGLLYHSDVLTQRDIIVSKVNRMAAGMAIHYLLDTKTAVSGGQNQNSINHSMSEAYAFMYGLHTLNGGIWATEIASMLAAIDTDFVGYTADNTKIDADIAAIAALAGISDPDSFQ